MNPSPPAAGASSRPLEHPPALAAMDGPYLVPWGRREILLALGLSVAATLGLALLASRSSPLWLLGLLVVLPLGAFFVLFFRNPTRRVPRGPGLLVSPADGTVVDIEELEEPDFLRGRAVRIGIFLSVFNVHVNRSPSAGRIAWLRHREGSFHDARSPLASLENESNTIGIEPGEGGDGAPVRLLVRQISGAIARRIICPLELGQQVARGGLVGMIKYGSRTELYIPVEAGVELLVRTGDKVRGGSTEVARLRTPSVPG